MSWRMRLCSRNRVSVMVKRILTSSYRFCLGRALMTAMLATQSAKRLDRGFATRSGLKSRVPKLKKRSGPRRALVTAMPVTQSAEQLSCACLEPSRDAPLLLLTAPNRRHVTSKERALVQAGQGFKPAGRPLMRLGWHSTIETRLCVNRMVTKTGPTLLG
jgi:hypothetical protein